MRGGHSGWQTEVAQPALLWRRGLSNLADFGRQEVRNAGPAGSGLSEGATSAQGYHSTALAGVALATTWMRRTCPRNIT